MTPAVCPLVFALTFAAVLHVAPAQAQLARTYVSSASANDAVSLRGLTVKGIGFGGGKGIVFNGGKSLTVENCAIRNLTGSGGVGITFQPNGPSSLAVSNTLVADNDGTGIAVVPLGSGA